MNNDEVGLLVTRLDQSTDTRKVPYVELWNDGDPWHNWPWRWKLHVDPPQNDWQCAAHGIAHWKWSAMWAARKKYRQMKRDERRKQKSNKPTYIEL